MKESIKKEVEKIKYKLGYEDRSTEVFFDSINWYYIATYHELSENFIKKFQNELEKYWFWISKHQKLSENFIIEFKDKVHWGNIVIYQKISRDFIYKMIEYLYENIFPTGIPLQYCLEHNLITEEYIKNESKITNRFEILDL